MINDSKSMSELNGRFELKVDSVICKFISLVYGYLLFLGHVANPKLSRK